MTWDFAYGYGRVPGFSWARKRANRVTHSSQIHTPSMMAKFLSVTGYCPPNRCSADFLQNEQTRDASRSGMGSAMIAGFSSSSVWEVRLFVREGVDVSGVMRSEERRVGKECRSR